MARQYDHACLITQASFKLDIFSQNICKSERYSLLCTSEAWLEPGMLRREAKHGGVVTLFRYRYMGAFQASSVARSGRPGRLTRLLPNGINAPKHYSQAPSLFITSFLNLQRQDFLPSHGKRAKNLTLKGIKISITFAIKFRASLLLRPRN